ncbi:MAG: usp-2 [Geobacteraceae bacterium]|nr:usp-2 [Geobacteraceae bacterium]
MKKIARILFATDLSFISEYAFTYAVCLAQRFDARLIVLHVVNVSLELCRVHEQHGSFEKIKAEIAHGAEKCLDEFCGKRLRYWNSMHGPDFTGYETCTVFGTPYKEVLRKAEEEKVDILVIGTHSRHDIDPLVFGSTAEKVLKLAACPVITVRPPFWMICMKFRCNPALPLARNGSFCTVRDKGRANENELPGPDVDPVPN